MRKIYFPKIDDNTPFQTIWLVDILNEHDMSFSDLSRLLHVSKQTITNWAASTHPMSFPCIAALIFLLKLDDDPEDVYKTIWKEMAK